MTRRIEVGCRHCVLVGVAVGATIAMAATTAAAGPSRDPRTPCFQITDWDGWRAPSPNVIYLGVRMHDVYRVELASDSPLLQGPNTHLVSRTRGPETVCSAVDLQLEVTDDVGFRDSEAGGRHVGLIAKTLTKLTSDEIAAIPKRYRPN